MDTPIHYVPFLVSDCVKKSPHVALNNNHKPLLVIVSISKHKLNLAERKREMTFMALEEFQLVRERVELWKQLRGYEEWQDLATEIGAEPRKLKRWLDHDSEIKASDLAKLAAALQLSSDYLVGRTDDPGLSAGSLNLSDAELALIAAARKGNDADAMELLSKLFRDNRRSNQS